MVPVGREWSCPSRWQEALEPRLVWWTGSRFAVSRFERFKQQTRADGHFNWVRT
jgi:hypothetical protein